MSQSSTVFQKVIKTHKRVICCIRVTYYLITMNSACVVYSSQLIKLVEQRESEPSLLSQREKKNKYNTTFIFVGFTWRNWRIST